MKRTKFDETKDQRVANEAGVPQALMCIAHGCPNRWAVDKGGGRLCSAHAWVDPEQWPAVTQQQQWDETERARMLGEPPAYAEPMTKGQKTRIVARMREILADFGKPKDPKAWAKRLRDREQGGERLSETQRTMWRAALGVDAASAWNSGGTIPEPKCEEEWTP